MFKVCISKNDGYHIEDVDIIHDVVEYLIKNNALNSPDTMIFNTEFNIINSVRACGGMIEKIKKELSQKDKNIRKETFKNLLKVFLTKLPSDATWMPFFNECEYNIALNDDDYENIKDFIAMNLQTNEFTCDAVLDSVKLSYQYAVENNQNGMNDE
jgi:hypothetical protein